MFSPDLLFSERIRGKMITGKLERQGEGYREFGERGGCRIGRNKYAREIGFACQCRVTVGAVCIIVICPQTCCGPISKVNFLASPCFPSLSHCGLPLHLTVLNRLQVWGKGTTHKTSLSLGCTTGGSHGWFTSPPTLHTCFVRCDVICSQLSLSHTC